MQEKKILIVDDEKPIADILKFNLEKEGYKVFCAYDGEDALLRVESIIPDLIILDIMLPKLDGMEVCKEVRKKYSMPIIMLTAKDSEFDKVLGLELGADDYVTKPFSSREITARVKANLRRNLINSAAEVAENTDIKLGDILINVGMYTVFKRNESIDLTRREFDLIHYLVRHPEQIMTREHLLQTVWGFDYFGDLRTVDVTVRRLREKIEDDPGNPKFILTRRGVGYYLKRPE